MVSTFCVPKKKKTKQKKKKISYCAVTDLYLCFTPVLVVDIGSIKI